jgi:hypothetical protein
VSATGVDPNVFLTKAIFSVEERSGTSTYFGAFNHQAVSAGVFLLLARKDITGSVPRTGR